MGELPKYPQRGEITVIPLGDKMTVIPSIVVKYRVCDLFILFILVIHCIHIMLHGLGMMFRGSAALVALPHTVRVASPHTVLVAQLHIP